MANSTVTATAYSYPNGTDNTQRRQIVTGTLAIQASPGVYATGGLSLSNVFNIETIKSSDNNSPAYLRFESVSGSGYIYGWNKANNKIQIFTGAAAQSPLTELSAGAMPAGVSGDVILFRGEWPRNA